MPEWFSNKNCKNYEAWIDQRIASWRSQIAEIKTAIKITT
jgi:hypothetical protein